MMARQTRDTRRTVGHHAELTMLRLKNSFFLLVETAPRHFLAFWYVSLDSGQNFPTRQNFAASLFSSMYLNYVWTCTRTFTWTYKTCTWKNANEREISAQSWQQLYFVCLLFFKDFFYERKHQHLYGQNAEVKSCKYMVFDSHLTFC